MVRQKATLILTCFALLLTSANSSASNLFKPVQTYNAGGMGASAVAIADLNGDGKLDLAVPTSNSVGILLGNGDGTFQSAVLYSLGSTIGASAIAIADMNLDGKLDLVADIPNNCTPNLDGCVAVLLGNGNGTFQSARKYDDGGAYSYSLKVADLNGDGKPDVVVADCSPDLGTSCGLYGVLLGRGNGTLIPVRLHNSGGVGAWSLVLGDVNGDGKLDLVIGNLCADASCAGNGVVAVILGNGNGTFKTPVTYDSGGRTKVPVIADVNGDGKPDIVVANAKGSTGVGVLLGVGNGTFNPVVTYDVGSKVPSSLTTADVNNDGILDVIVASNPHVNGAQVLVLLGNGDGTFQSPSKFDSGGMDALGLAVADLDKDGRADVVVANCAGIGQPCDNTQPGVVGVLLGASTFATTPVLTSKPSKVHRLY